MFQKSNKLRLSRVFLLLKDYLNLEKHAKQLLLTYLIFRINFMTYKPS